MRPTRLRGPECRTPRARRGLLALLCLTVGSITVAAPDLEHLPRLEDKVTRTAAARAYTPKELTRFDGTNPELPVLLAVRGVVFDVSKGRDFYAPGSTYHGLAGRDSSRAIARWSLDPQDANDLCEGLTAKQWKELTEILESTYLARYPVVGHVDGGYFFPNGLCCNESDCGDC